MFVASKARPVLEADNLTAIRELIFVDNVGSSVSYIPIDLLGRLLGELQFLYVDHIRISQVI
jgi:hypothetical protein